MLIHMLREGEDMHSTGRRAPNELFGSHYLIIIALVQDPTLTCAPC